jgi:hypothetical protein
MIAYPIQSEQVCGRKSVRTPCRRRRPIFPADSIDARDHPTVLVPKAAAPPVPPVFPHISGHRRMDLVQTGPVRGEDDYRGVAMFPEQLVRVFRLEPGDDILAAEVRRMHPPAFFQIGIIMIRLLTDHLRHMFRITAVLLAIPDHTVGPPMDEDADLSTLESVRDRHGLQRFPTAVVLRRPRTPAAAHGNKNHSRNQSQSRPLHFILRPDCR